MIGTTPSEKPLYAITITFKEIHSKTPKGQFKETYKTVCRILAQSTDFEIYPEYRLLSGEIHYHGTIDIKDNIKWLKATLRQLKGLGFCKLKKIDDLQGWLKYCEKEMSQSQELIGLKLPIKNEMWKHNPKLEQILIEDDKVSKINKCTCIECKLKNFKRI